MYPFVIHHQKRTPGTPGNNAASKYKCKPGIHHELSKKNPGTYQHKFFLEIFDKLLETNYSIIILYCQ